MIIQNILEIASGVFIGGVALWIAYGIFDGFTNPRYK